MVGDGARPVHGRQQGSRPPCGVWYPFVAGLRDRYDLMVGFAYAVYYGKTGIHAFQEEILIFPLVSVEA